MKLMVSTLPAITLSTVGSSLVLVELSTDGTGTSAVDISAFGDTMPDRHLQDHGVFGTSPLFGATDPPCVLSVFAFSFPRTHDRPFFSGPRSRRTASRRCTRT